MQPNTISLSLGSHINLEATLECGQAFRWKKTGFPGDGRVQVSYLGVIPHLGGAEGQEPRQIAVIVGQNASVTHDIRVAYDSFTPREIVESSVLRYFSAQDDLLHIEDQIVEGDPGVAEAVGRNRGLRILLQDPWETLASYLLSIHNNIGNITRIVECLASGLGEPVGLGEHGFPSAQQISLVEPEYLREAKCGFRGSYLLDAACRVAAGEVDLAEIGGMPTPEAREALMKVRGVGPKVADCVLLFAYHRLEVFPVDVWIARAVSRRYLDGREVTPKSAREEGMRRFGKLAGYAQEHLFRDARS